MNKRAPVKYEILDVIAERWSPRAFSSRPVEPEKLKSLFEAARWAASCFNEQPWRFILADREDAPTFQRMLDCLSEGNQRWVQYAPVLVLSVASTQFKHNGKDNRHAFHDVGQAAAYLALQAVALGLVVHQMAGFDREKVRQALSIPAGHEPVAAIAIGYQDSPDVLPDDMAQKERALRSRREQADFVYGGSWGEPWE